MNFANNTVEQGSAITHTASTDTFTLTGDGVYRISYSVVATNTSSTGTVGVELEDNSTAIDGSKSTATIATASNTATLAASVLVSVTGSTTITLNTTEANVTITDAGIEIQKLN